MNLPTLTSVEADALAGSLAPGIFMAWLLARKRFWGKTLVDGLVRPDAGRIRIRRTCLFDSARGIDLPP